MSSISNFKQTEIGTIPTDWEVSTLKDICAKKGGVQTGPFGSQLHKKDYKETGTPIITVEHLGENRIIHHNLPFVSDEDCQRLFRYSLKEGDIVFSRVGSVDRRAYVTKKEDGWLFSGRCLRVRPDPKIVNSSYLSWFFGYHIFTDYIRRIAVGATMPSLNTKLLENVPIIFPPLEEQNFIASILNSLNDKIELNRRMNATLEQIAQAIFKQWFIDFEFPDENGQPYKSSGGEMVESELGEIPRGWEVKELKNFGNIICGKTPSKKIHDYYEDGTISFIKIPDMRNNIFPIDTEDKLSKKGAEAIYKKKIPANSVCVSCIATVGLVCLTNEEAYTNQQINSIIPASSVSPYYLYFAMKELYEKLHLWASGGSATLNLNTKQFSEIKIVMPPVDVMAKFDDNDTIFKKILCNSVESKVLSQIRDSLLPKLMSGKIRISV